MVDSWWKSPRNCLRERRLSSCPSIQATGSPRTTVPPFIEPSLPLKKTLRKAALSTPKRCSGNCGHRDTAQDPFHGDRPESCSTPQALVVGELCASGDPPARLDKAIETMSLLPGIGARYPSAPIP